MAAVQRAHHSIRSRPDPKAAAAEKSFNQGRAHGTGGRWSEAARCFEASTAWLPQHAMSWLRLAEAQRHLARYDEAVAAAERALSIDPSLNAGYFIVIVSRLEQYRHLELAQWLGRPEVSEHLDHVGWAEFGFALFKIGRFQESIQALFTSMSRQLDYMPAYLTLGNVFDHMKMPGAALESFRTAAILKPDNAQVWSGLVHHSQYACQWSQLDADMAGLHAALASSSEPVNPFALVTMPSTGRQQLDESRRFVERRFGVRKPWPAAVVRPAGERLRIGYLSCDYYSHATATLVAELFEKHDRSRFDVLLYSYSPPEQSAVRRRLEASGDRFVDLNGITDEVAARRIRDDGVDILIDLKGHTRDSRSGILAWRPAPVQVNYLGFPGTMGADFVDYIVTDPIVTPHESAGDFAEQLAYLPVCYQPNDRQRPVDERPSRSDCGLPDDAVVLCCFNKNYKITPAVFDAWCRILTAVPGTVLWLLASNPESTLNLAREAERRGIDAARIVFAQPVQIARNLARLQNADLFLDTSPVNAHTTASDSLWAGLPVLTFPGYTFVSRVAASLVSAAGVPQLVADSLEHYEQRAIELARDPQLLGALKRQLIDTRLSVALFDSSVYTRELEALYERMADVARTGSGAEHLMPASRWPRA
ncbi:hypothetical protein BH09PSE6_BH09PSE6_30980 [soil metagenome]